MIGVPSQQYRKKPTMQQTELADLHFVDAKRIKELGNAAELGRKEPGAAGSASESLRQRTPALH